MKNNPHQQELLLLTTTTFSQREWCEKNPSDCNYHRSSVDQLEEACWNGLLHDLLHEIMERSASGKRLLLWHVWKRPSLLQLEWSEFPASLEKDLSIITSFFLPTMIVN